MGIFKPKFDDKKKEIIQPSKAKPNRPPKDITEKDLDALENEFDFGKIEDPALARFAKFYILCGSNGTKAYKKLRNDNVSNETAAVGANRYLRKLRQHPDFWDLLGLGYNNLKEVTDQLIKNKPEKAIDIIMKVNKEDTERVESQVTVVLANELSRDYK